MFRTIALGALIATTPMMAHALTKVEDRSEFVSLVEGRTLARSLIQLNVLPNGQIEGRGAGRDVTGTWNWDGGYFCRDLFWGKRKLGYNCQEVSADGGTIRFQSDRGAGDIADFMLK